MKIYITRKIPESGINKLKEAGHEVDINLEDKVLSKEELISALSKKPYDAVLCLLTDKIDDEIFQAAPQAKIFANYAVGYNNIDLEAAEKNKKIITNTPGVLTETVAEYTFALILSIAHRITEADKFTKAGEYKGWAPTLLLGTDVSKKVLGIIGLGRIGLQVAQHAVKGFGMKIVYYDVKKNEEVDYEYKDNVGDVLKGSDFVSVHVPLLDSTRHLIDEEKLRLMKPTAYLINTSRGPVIDEKALVSVLKEKVIKGAALDVFEDEPVLTEGLAELENAILTPHIASGTEETRAKMSDIAAENILSVLNGENPPNLVKKEQI
ncbi:MAG: D-glycerate dehydrogenase [Patescibacteria group bacterium]